MATARLDESTDLGIERAKGGKRRMVIIIAVAAVLALGAAGGAAWYVLGGDQTPTATGAKAGWCGP